MHANYAVFPNSPFDELKVRGTVLYSQPCSVKMKYTDVLYSPGTHDLYLFSAMALHTHRLKIDPF